ncbi:hypothetical protein EZS27_042204, partial [termite gut metagenome]
PMGEVMGQHTPLTTGFYQVNNRIPDFTQGM